MLTISSTVFPISSQKPRSHSNVFLSLILHVQLSAILSVLSSKYIRTWSCHTTSELPLRVKPLPSAWTTVIKINLLITISYHFCSPCFILSMGARMMLKVNHYFFFNTFFLLLYAPYLTYYNIYLFFTHEIKRYLRVTVSQVAVDIAST